MTAKAISWLALFTALSAVGSMIKVPAPAGSVALDSFPALIAAVLLGPGAGALSAAAGHVLSAAVAGLPMGPLHLVVAAEMAALLFLFGVLYKRKAGKTAFIIFWSANTLLLPLPFAFIMGWGFYAAMVPSLAVAALLNAGLAAVLAPRLQALFEKRSFHA